MEIEVIDVIFWVVITVIVLGGLASLVIFLPKEHDYENKYANCFRIQYRDGAYSLSSKKPTYGENSFSVRSKFFYISRVPFEVNAICDGADAADGKNYRAAAVVTVCFPEDKLQVFAPTFHQVAHEAIVETLEETLSSAMEAALRKYDPSAGDEAFTELLRAEAKEKLGIFGVFLMKIGTARITENK